MSILDPLAPYLGLIRIGLYAAIVAGAFLGGCSHGKSAQREADRARLDKAAADLRAAGAALEASAAALYEVDALTRAAKHAADVQAKRAREEVAAAQRDAEEYQDQLASIERELEQAKRDPACKQLLEVASCAVLR
jgi:outer membrane murein-binding lipoprotein Lpp